jgi:hypothetical protein
MVTPAQERPISLLDRWVCRDLELVRKVRISAETSILWARSDHFVLRYGPLVGFYQVFTCDQAELLARSLLKKSYSDESTRFGQLEFDWLASFDLETRKLTEPCGPTWVGWRGEASYKLGDELFLHAGTSWGDRRYLVEGKRGADLEEGVNRGYGTPLTPSEAELAARTILIALHDREHVAAD